MTEIRIDKRGVGEVLKRLAAPTVNAAAEQIAAGTRIPDEAAEGEREQPTVTVRRYTTDRGAAAVTIEHPAGMAIQAKHGTLTRAAAAAGYEVRAK